ncbi:MAG TPA: NIPSNAP family protein [Phycisphaerae bacterium]|nr:NIPSNAP family protein [Phycisphaerae bacterium]
MDTRVFELRTYTAMPGKIEVLHARFRDYTLKLFEKHHMTVVGFWRPAEEQQAKRQLVYLLAFPSQEAALQSWKDFQADPEWKNVKEASEKDGRIVEKIDSVYLKPTDYSPRI